MQPGTQVSSPILNPDVVVKIDDDVVACQEISVSRELSTDLPGQIVGGGAVSAATGSASLVPDAAVGGRVATPWSVGTWPPSAGQKCTVDVGFNGSRWRQLTGIVDSASGRFGSGEVSANLVDSTDALRRVVSIPVGLSQKYSTRTALSVLGSVLTVGGYGAGVPISEKSIVYVPSLGGSNAAVVGVDDVVNTDKRSPTWVKCAWGSGAAYKNGPFWFASPMPTLVGYYEFAADIDCTGSGVWQGPGIYSSSDGKALGGNIASINVNSIQNGSGDVSFFAYNGTVVSGNAAAARVYTKSGRLRVLCRVNVASDYSYFVDYYAYDPAGDPPSAPRASVRFPVSTTLQNAQRIGVGAGSGQVAAMCGIRLDYSTAQFTGAPPVGGTNLQMWVSSTDPVADGCPVAVSPSVTGRVAHEVAREIASATLASMWIDENGVMQVWGRNAMREKPTSATVKSSVNLLDVGWATDTSGVARSVTLSREIPTVNEAPASAPYGQTVYVAQDINLKPGETYSEVVHPDEKVDWVDVDVSLSWPWGISAADLAARNGSWVGRSNEDGTPTSNAFTSSLKMLDPRTLRYTMTSFASNTGNTSNRFDNNFAAVALRGSPSPIVRARATVGWSDAEAVGATIGPEWAPDIVHDGGRWLQEVGGVDYGKKIVDELSARLSSPEPAIESLDIVPDPRIQLGDRITVVDDYGSGVSIDAVVAGSSINFSDSAASQSLKLRVIAVQLPNPTLGQMDDVWVESSAAAFDATWSGDPLSAIDADPLYREEYNTDIALHDAAWDGKTLADLDATWAGRTLGNFDSAPLTTP